MAATCFYPKRNGDYVYDVTVAKDEAVRLSHRYRAHLDHAERIENGRLTPVQVEVADAVRANRLGGHVGARCVV